jgi:hypothetical protein
VPALYVGAVATFGKGPDGRLLAQWTTEDGPLAFTIAPSVQRLRRRATRREAAVSAELEVSHTKPIRQIG